MNIEIMRKHYERTPKETLINVLVASREQVDKLQKRNKELKQEIERLKELCDKYEEEHNNEFKKWQEVTRRIDKAINRISLVRMDRDTSIETHKALDEILNILLGSDKE